MNGAEPTERPDAADQGAPASSDRSTLGAVRLRITEGDLSLARARFDAIDPRIVLTPEGWLTEAALLEAEGRAEEALERLRRAVALRRGSAQVNAALARLAARLGLGEEAERAARVALSVDPDNLDALDALAATLEAGGQVERRIDVLRRIALAGQANEERIWTAIDALAGMGAWSDVLAILPQREDVLNPRQVARTHLLGLISLGWGRRAFNLLRESHRAGRVRGAEGVEWLVDAGALMVAAWFLQDASVEDGSLADARAAVIARATEVAQSTRLNEKPLVVADAIGARALLVAGREGLAEAGERLAPVLERQASLLLAKGEAGAGVDHLVSAARLAPGDINILKALSVAAQKAGREERRRDTLARIATLEPDAETLTAAAVAGCAAGDMSAVQAVLDLSAAKPELSSAVMARLRERLVHDLLDLVSLGDWRAALDLASWSERSRLRPDWPEGLIARLLVGAKRWLRGFSGGPNGPTESALANYLTIDPTDLDVKRLLARIWIRQRRQSEAAGLLRDTLAADPHVARDWISLGQAYHDLGDFRGRDHCTARALAISPDAMLPVALKPFLDRMRPA